MSYTCENVYGQLYWDDFNMKIKGGSNNIILFYENSNRRPYQSFTPKIGYSVGLSFGYKFSGKSSIEANSMFVNDRGRLNGVREKYRDSQRNANGQIESFLVFEREGNVNLSQGFYQLSLNYHHRFSDRYSFFSGGHINYLLLSRSPYRFTEIKYYDYDFRQKKFVPFPSPETYEASFNYGKFGYGLGIKIGGEYILHKKEKVNYFLRMECDIPLPIIEGLSYIPVRIGIMAGIEL
jgi:hypothetical protein